MEKLWGKFWFRLLAWIIGAPLILVPVITSAVLAATYVMERTFGTFVMMSPAVPFELAWMSWILTLPPFIGFEVVNRRMGRVLPPSLCAGFVAVAGFAWIGCLLVAIKTVIQLGDVNQWALITAILLGVYFGGAGCAVAILYPFIQRWRKRSAMLNSDRAAGQF